MKILAVTQARVGSSRLPAKVLKEINGVSILAMHIRRILKSTAITKLIVATTEESGSDTICEICKQEGVTYFQGSLNDVLDRYYQTVVNEQPDYVVRITSDCPLIDPVMIDNVVTNTVSACADYGSNGFVTVFPDGQDVEVFKFSALEKAWREATLESDREHVTPYIWRNSSLNGGNLFLSVNYTEDVNYGNVRMTLDESSDLEVIQALVYQFGVNEEWKVYADYYLSHPQIHQRNTHIERNEGYQKSLTNDNN
jgi:spore coat polysaccharide biosynthesis protein SpsF (cytidylyltransferase family)